MGFKLPDYFRKEIERIAGFPIRYPSDCVMLSMSLRDKINETIGVTTLKRLFGFVADVTEPRLSTLDLLAIYCGYENYDEIKHRLGGEEISGFEKQPDIDAANLPPGSIVGFKYPDDRKIKLRYLGYYRFLVEDSVKSSLKKGDIITVTSFSEGHPMIASSVVRDGNNLGRYTAGKVVGITDLYRELPDENS